MLVHRMAGAAATNPKRHSGTGVSADEVRNATATTSHAPGTLAATTLDGLTTMAAMVNGSVGEVESLLTCHAARSRRRGERRRGTPSVLAAVGREEER